MRAHRSPGKASMGGAAVRALAVALLLGGLGAGWAFHAAAGPGNQGSAPTFTITPLPSRPSALAPLSPSGLGPVTAPTAVGSASPSPPGLLRLVVLGDSVATGDMCDCTGFTQEYAELMAAATGATVAASNLAVNGNTTNGVLAQLGSATTESRSVAAADVVVVVIGANDLGAQFAGYLNGGCDLGCVRQALPPMGSNVTAIVNRVQALRHGRPTEVLVADYWNLFPDGDVAEQEYGSAYLSWSDSATRMTNAVICSAATSAGARCIDLYTPFKGSGRDPTLLLAADGDHPNKAGHHVIARALAAHGWKELIG